MLVRIALIGCLFATAGCGREAERSRVVPASEAGKDAAGRPAPQDIRKIEMH